MLKLISWDDFWVRVTQVTADDISSIQMVMSRMCVNMSKCAPHVNCFPNPVNSEITNVHKPEVI